MNETRINIDLSQVASQCSSFTLFVHEGYTLIRAVEALTEDDIIALENALAEIEAVNSQGHLIDFSISQDINTVWLKFLDGLVLKTKDSGRKLVALNVDPTTKELLNLSGIGAHLTFCNSWAESMNALGVPHTPGTLALEMIAPFLESASKAVELQMMTTCTRRSPAPILGTTPISGDICGIIPLDCGSFQAIVVITFPQKTILDLVGKLTGAPPSAIDSLVKGCVGEITNIAFTRGKKRLNEMGFGIKSALPKVFQEKTLPLEFGKYSGKGVLVPFDTGCGECFAEVRLAVA